VEDDSSFPAGAGGFLFLERPMNASFAIVIGMAIAFCADRPTNVELSVHWNREIVDVADPTEAPKEGFCLIGGCYLFDSNGDPVRRAGRLQVCLLNESRPEQPVSEIWQIDSTMLQKMARKDTVGWGYTLVLPTYRCIPNLTAFRLFVTFYPDQGSPLYDDGAPIIFHIPSQRADRP
jgi:hypothetical protein